jgi:hypothetical protein
MGRCRRSRMATRRMFPQPLHSSASGPCTPQYQSWPRRCRVRSCLPQLAQTGAEMLSAPALRSAISRFPTTRGAGERPSVRTAGRASNAWARWRRLARPPATLATHVGDARPVECRLEAGGTLLTALAERFQHNREIRRDDPAGPLAYGWQPTRPLSLIDLTGIGAITIGAAHALSGYRKDVCRRWARALRAAWPDADGLLYASTMTEQPCTALWAPARDSFPSSPRFAMALDTASSRWQATLRDAAAALHYTYA